VSRGDIIGIIIGVALFVISLPVTFLIGRRARQNLDLRYATDFDVLVAPNQPSIPGRTLINASWSHLKANL